MWHKMRTLLLQKTYDTFSQSEHTTPPHECKFSGQHHGLVTLQQPIKWEQGTRTHLSSVPSELDCERGGEGLEVLGFRQLRHEGLGINVQPASPHLHLKFKARTQSSEPKIPKSNSDLRLVWWGPSQLRHQGLWVGVQPPCVRVMK